tara:strand:- start:1330 stop:1575 length:246 start_codon:yes stop_codon:yes gene_type:complete
MVAGNDEYDAVLEKLREALKETEDGNIRVFNEDEVVTLRRVIRAVDFLETFGVVGKYVLQLGILVGAGWAAWKGIFTGGGQ